MSETIDWDTDVSEILRILKSKATSTEEPTPEIPLTFEGKQVTFDDVPLYVDDFHPSFRKVVGGIHEFILNDLRENWDPVMIDDEFVDKAYKCASAAFSKPIEKHETQTYDVKLNIAVETLARFVFLNREDNIFMKGCRAIFSPLAEHRCYTRLFGGSKTKTAKFNAKKKRNRAKATRWNQRGGMNIRQIKTQVFRKAGMYNIFAFCGLIFFICIWSRGETIQTNYEDNPQNATSYFVDKTQASDIYQAWFTPECSDIHGYDNLNVWEVADEFFKRYRADILSEKTPRYTNFDGTIDATIAINDLLGSREFDNDTEIYTKPFSEGKEAAVEVFKRHLEVATNEHGLQDKIIRRNSVLSYTGLDESSKIRTNGRCVDRIRLHIALTEFHSSLILWFIKGSEKMPRVLFYLLNGGGYFCNIAFNYLYLTAVLTLIWFQLKLWGNNYIDIPGENETISSEDLDDVIRSQKWKLFHMNMKNVSLVVNCFILPQFIVDGDSYFLAVASQIINSLMGRQNLLEYRTHYADRTFNKHIGTLVDMKAVKTSIREWVSQGLKIKNPKGLLIDTPLQFNYSNPSLQTLMNYLFFSQNNSKTLLSLIINSLAEAKTKVQRAKVATVINAFVTTVDNQQVFNVGDITGIYDVFLKLDTSSCRHWMLQVTYELSVTDTTTQINQIELLEERRRSQN
jgi:hypothetical protein